MQKDEFKDIDEVELGKINGPLDNSQQKLNAPLETDGSAAPKKLGGFQVSLSSLPYLTFYHFIEKTIICRINDEETRSR